MVYEHAINALKGEKTQSMLAALYGDNNRPKERFQRLVRQHQQSFHTADSLSLLCAPGRAELVGNHTDHNRGMVLAAAVNLDIAAAASLREDLKVTLKSDGYAPISLSLEHLQPVASEAGSSAALIRGVAAGMREKGYAIGGFDAVMSSDVLSGSGLSSSAAFEVLVCAILDALYNGFTLDPVSRAQLSQKAENAFFMKPSGLMDQMASSFGGIVAIDFKDDPPLVESLHFSFAKAGYAMTIVNTGGSHDDLTDAYSAIPADMKAAARSLGVSLLRESSYQQLLKALPRVRQEADDMAALRAMHYYQENQRVTEAVCALKDKDIGAFFGAVASSGLSSWTLLQNISVSSRGQPMALALARAQSALGGRGACRVHGGGFAGTTLNFVPFDLLDEFTLGMEALFGKGSCHVLDVRKQGPVLLLTA